MSIFKSTFLVFTILMGLRTLIRVLVHYDLLHVAEPEPFPFIELTFQIVLCMVYVLLFCK